MAIAATLTVRLSATQTGPNDFTDKFTPLIEKIQKITDGTTTNKADILFCDERSISTGANDDIDLAGSLTDAFGVTITAAEIVAILVINAPISGSANSTDLTIGAGANPFIGFLGATDTIGPIKPGGFFMLGAGHASGIGAVTAGTGDILRIANSSGATVTYQIAILARTA